MTEENKPTPLGALLTSLCLPALPKVNPPPGTASAKAETAQGYCRWSHKGKHAEKERLRAKAVEPQLPQYLLSYLLVRCCFDDRAGYLLGSIFYRPQGGQHVIWMLSCVLILYQHFFEDDRGTIIDETC